MLDFEESNIYSYPFNLPEEFYRTSVVDNINDSNMVAKVHSLQTYINTLTSKLDYYIPPLLDFLNIMQSNRNYYENERAKLHNNLALNLTMEESNRANLFRSESEPLKI